MYRTVLCALALAAVAATAAMAAPALVFKVDHVTAGITGRHLILTADGAAATGGWSNPQLRIVRARPAEANFEAYEFVATPPPADAVVVQALVPVHVTAQFPLPRYATTEIRVIASSNSITAPLRVQPPPRDR